VAQLLADLDTRYPGIRFRMVNEADALRPHVRVFVNREAIGDLDTPVSGNDDVMIVQALSGG
jgi:molybdopterin converting factor small subunit